MELKKINLLKDRYCLIPLIGVPWRSQIYRDRKQMVGARGGGGDGDSEFQAGRQNQGSDRASMPGNFSQPKQGHPSQSRVQASA